MARVARQPLHKLKLLPSPPPVKGTRRAGSRDAALDLQPGELVRVKSKEQIGTTVSVDGRNRGLGFDWEMLPFCEKVYAVRQRIKKFIDDRTGYMIELKTDAVTLDGVVCSGDYSHGRWFCSRGIFPYWREAWLERVGPRAAPATEDSARF
jgi:hypothetical protein